MHVVTSRLSYAGSVSEQARNNVITIPHLHDFVEQLPDDLRQIVIHRARERSVAKGDAVYRQGEAPVECFQILSGTIKICSYSTAGAELITMELRDGDCFGEMGVIDELPRVSHAIAVTPCVLRVWTRADFDGLNEQYPAFNRAVMRMLARRTRLAYSLWIESSGLSLRERLAVAICRLAYTIAGDPAETDIPISQEALGQMLGASRQTVNKELQQLASAKLVTLRYGKIRVTDLSQLVRLYGNLLGTEPVAASYRTD
jgi:CRP-like cAMP-binding protein